MVATAIVLLCTLASAPHKAEVTFNDPPARLENLLVSLSKTANATLTCSNALKDRVLFVQAEGADLQDLLDRIAYVVDGKWERSGTKMTLVVDQSSLERRRQAYRNVNKLDVENGLISLDEDKPKKFTEQEALNLAFLLEDLANSQPELSMDLHWARQRAYAGVPVARLGKALYAKILEESPDKLPLAKPGRVVFTNLRNTPYESMRVDPALLEQYEEEQAVWDKVVTARSAINERYVYNNSSTSAQHSTRPAQAVFLMAYKTTKFDQTKVAIGLLDDLGAYKSGAEFGFLTQSAQDRRNRLLSGPLDGTKLTLSPEAMRYALAASVSQEPPVRIRPGDPLYKKVIDPVKYDPLGLALGEIVAQILSDSVGPIVAELSDDFGWTTTDVVREGGITVETVRRRFEVIDEASIESHDDGFVTMRFEDPDTHEKNFPRESLMQIAQCLDRLGYLDLRTLVEHGFPGGRSLAPAVPFFTLRILAPGYERHLQSFNQALPNYASALTPSERTALLNGRPVTIGQLTYGSKVRLNKLLIGSSEIYGINVAFRNVRIPYPLANVLLFPRGIPDDVTLRIDARTMPGMAAFLPKVDNMTNWYVFGGEGMALSAIGSRIGQTNVPFRIWKGEHINGWFKLEQNNQTLVQYMVDLAMIDVRGRPLSVSDLSEDQQKRIEQARVSAESRNALENQRRKPPPAS